MLLDFLRLVFRDLWRRKVSSFLTLFAISLGILTIFVIFLLGAGFESSIEKQFEQIGSNRLYLTSSAQSIASTTFVKGLDDNIISLVEKRSYVDRVYPYYGRVTQVEYSNEFLDVQIFSTVLSEDLFDEFNLGLDKGRFPKESEKYSTVIGSLVAEDLYEKEVLVGSNLYVKGVKFKVVGILEPVGSPPDDSVIYFNIDTIRDVFDAGDSVGFADVIIVEGYDVELAEENLRIFLENRLGEDSFDISSPTQLLEQASSILRVVQLSLGGIAFVALIVGALGIINMMYVIVTEKRKDIGIMKAVGARNRDILFLFVLQAGIFGLFGAILGIFLGSFAAIGFEVAAKASGYTFLEIAIEPQIAGSLLVFGFVIGAVSGFLPAYRASKVNIIDAIRK